MKQGFLIAISFVFFCTTLFFAFRIEKSPQKEIFNLEAYKSKNIVRCSPDWQELSGWLENSDIPPMPGTGSHIWKISTQNDSAQFYFNQGINMYFGFHILESMASFEKAKRFDPDCAMLWWALALGYGPNINDLGYSASPEALEAIKMARKFAEKATAEEKTLIDAMSVRYTSDSTISRKTLNELYTGKMAAAHLKFKNNYNIATLYADAMMLEHPWELWNIDGTAKSWTPKIENLLEKILDKSPDHPGANHYYIHVMEPSPSYAKAVPSANRLGRLTPGLAHMVHMPSHIYLRNGNYENGITVNINAEKSYNNYSSLFPAVVDNSFLYLWHAKHMQMNCAMMAGEKVNSEKAATELQQMIDPSMLSLEAPLGAYVQYLYYGNILSYIRFGNWETLLSLDEPQKEHIFAGVLFHFGRGMAFANTNNISQANKELLKLRGLMKDSVLKIPLNPFSPAIDGATIAENLLAGTIELKRNRINTAIEHFSIAVRTEEKMVYNEPRDWLLNPKPYLGNALLVAQQWDEAEKVFLKDLENNSENGWSLFGLYRVANAKRNTTDENKYLSRYKKAFTKADIQLKSPVF